MFIAKSLVAQLLWPFAERGLNRALDELPNVFKRLRAEKGPDPAAQQALEEARRAYEDLQASYQGLYRQVAELDQEYRARLRLLVGLGAAMALLALGAAGSAWLGWTVVAITLGVLPLALLLGAGIVAWLRRARR